MTTTARWRVSKEVIYVTYNVEASFKREGNFRTLRLTYESTKQTDPNVTGLPRGIIRYGSSTITWTNGETSGNVQWDDSDGDSKDFSTKVSVLGGQPLQISERAQRSVLVTTRPKQADFRDALFYLDKQCVLTGETCREALEAAHIVPVAQNGHEGINNGILLRADLHLLFDAGLIWFKVSNDQAAVCCSPDDRMKHYATYLGKNKYLPRDTFLRVKDALLIRAKLPGGQGINT